MSFFFSTAPPPDPSSNPIHPLAPAPHRSRLGSRQATGRRRISLPRAPARPLRPPLGLARGAPPLPRGRSLTSTPPPRRLRKGLTADARHRPPCRLLFPAAASPTPSLPHGQCCAGEHICAGMGSPAGIKSPVGVEDGEISSPVTVGGDGDGEIMCAASSLLAPPSRSVPNPSSLCDPLFSFCLVYPRSTTCRLVRGRQGQS